MAEVNLDLYKTQPQNPLDNISKTVGIANAVEQNRLLQGQQVQQNIGIDKSKLELAASQLGQLRSMFAPHLNNPNVSTKDITQIGVDAIKQGLATPQQVATELARFPRDGTPQQKQSWVRDMYVRSLSHETQINMMLGTPQTIDTGGGKTVVQQPVRPDQGTAQRGVIPNTLQPGTPIYNPTKRQQEIVSEGQPGTFTPPSGVQRQPVAPARPAQNGAPAASAAPAKGPERLPTAAPLGEPEAAKEAAGQSGQLLAKDRENAADFRRQVFPLEQAIPKLESLGKMGTGPGSEETNNLKSFLQTLGIPGFNAEKIKNYDEANKYLTDWVMANGNVATNDKLAASFASNASTKISNAAAIDVAKAALAIRRMKQAQVDAFEATGKPENEYSRWASQWNKGQDPRVYGFDLMTPKQRNAVLSGLPPAKRSQFLMDVERASEMGLIRPPSAPQEKPEPPARNKNGA